MSWESTTFYYSVNVEQSSAFLMMVLADVTASKCHDYNNGNDEIVLYESKGYDEDTYLGVHVGFYVAKKYSKAKNEFIHSGADSTGGIPEAINYGGMVHGHMPGTYYFLANDYYDKLEEVV